MIGGEIHERVILDPLEGLFNERDAETARNVAVQMGAKRGHVDLVA